MYAVCYERQVIERDIPDLCRATRALIKKAIEAKLMADPVHFGKPLRYSLKGHRRLRVGDYRVIYRIDEAAKTVYVITIGHRKDVYES